MRCGNERAGFRLSSLQCNDAFTLVVGKLGKLSETNWLAHGFDKHADCGHAVVINKQLQRIFNATACLVAHSDHVGHVQTALLHSEIDSHVATLRNDANAVFHWSAPMLVWPQCNAV